MKISFENFGVIDKGEIEQKPLTILCGENNTGKTYAMYAMYGVLTNRSDPFEYNLLKELSDKLGTYLNQGNSSIDFNLVDFIEREFDSLEASISITLNQVIINLFSDRSNSLKLSNISIKTKKPLILDHAKAYGFRFLPKMLNQINLSITKSSYNDHIKIFSFDSLNDDLIQEILHFVSAQIFNIFIKYPSETIILPAERAGLNLFYPELNAYRTHLLHGFRQDNFILSKYPKPIADYIDWLNLIPNYKTQKSELFSSLSTTLQNNILGGSYSFDETNSINFHLNNQKDTLPLHLTSSTVKTYFGLWFYLQHMAQEGDVLMIDEPELSLHPSNQRKIARLLVQLVNKGIKVVISTHSDYMVREFNSLIMLGHAQDEKSKQELMAKYNYQEDELLTKDKVGAYLFHNNTIDSMEITEDEGILATTFDEVIHQLNESSDDIYYSLKDSNE